MCLFITVKPHTADFNRTLVKRLLKGASFLSAFQREQSDRLYYLGNIAHCACDLREPGPDPESSAIQLKGSTNRALLNIASALVSGGIVPFELRVFWAGNGALQQKAMSLSEFAAVAEANAFDGRASYLIR